MIQYSLTSRLQGHDCKSLGRPGGNSARTRLVAALVRPVVREVIRLQTRDSHDSLDVGVDRDASEAAWEIVVEETAKLTGVVRPSDGILQVTSE